MEYELKLPQQHVQLILNALAELPFKVVASTCTIIQQQVMAQDHARAEPMTVLGQP